MVEMAKNWILQNIMEAISESSQQFLTVFGSAIENIFGAVMDLNSKYLQGVDTFTSIFAIAFIGLLVTKQYFMVYVLETSGDPEADPIDLYVRAAQATAMATCSGALFDIFMDFSGAFVNDLQSVKITASGNVSSGMADTLMDLISIPANFSAIPIVISVTSVAMIIALVVFCIIAGIRGAELLFMKMLFPIFCCDLVTTNRERFNSFFVSFIITAVGYGMQLIAFKMFNVTLLLYLTCDMSEFPLIFATNIGWMILMFKAPKWLEKFCFSSGLSSTTGGILRTLPMLMRMK